MYWFPRVATNYQRLGSLTEIYSLTVLKIKKFRSLKSIRVVLSGGSMPLLASGGPSYP